MFTTELALGEMMQKASRCQGISFHKMVVLVNTSVGVELQFLHTWVNCSVSDFSVLVQGWVLQMVLTNRL